jgi:hypothetical protein
MAPNAPILVALAQSCRMLSSANQLQSVDKKEVFEFHLEWLSLCARYRDPVYTARSSREMEAQSADLALRMAQFIVNHE